MNLHSEHTALRHSRDNAIAQGESQEWEMYFQQPQSMTTWSHWMYAWSVWPWLELEPDLLPSSWKEAFQGMLSAPLSLDDLPRSVEAFGAWESKNLLHDNDASRFVHAWTRQHGVDAVQSCMQRNASLAEKLLRMSLQSRTNLEHVGKTYVSLEGNMNSSIRDYYIFKILTLPLKQQVEFFQGFSKNEFTSDVPAIDATQHPPCIHPTLQRLVEHSGYWKGFVDNLTNTALVQHFSPRIEWSLLEGLMPKNKRFEAMDFTGIEIEYTF